MAAMRASGVAWWLAAIGLLVACEEGGKKPTDTTSNEGVAGAGVAGAAGSTVATAGTAGSDGAAGAGGAPEACATICPGSEACVDLDADALHCGSCDSVCKADETCSVGECVCAGVLERCGQTCRDFQNDPLNCGKCNHSCGNGACSEGECGCAEGSVDCSTNNVLSCRPVQDDVKNCGDCDKRCLDSGACSAGQCDAEVQLVRLIGGAAPAPYRATLALGASGDLFAAVQADGEHLVLPGGKISLFEGDNAIIKLDANLDFVWSVIVSGSAQVVADGDDVWVVMSASGTNITIGDDSFEPDNQFDGQVVVVAKLSGADGHLLESHRFGGDLAGREPKLVVTGAGAFLATNLATSIEYLGTTSLPPEPYYYAALFRLGKPSPRWVPGELLSLSADDHGKLVVGVMAPEIVPISFGGDPLKSGLHHGNIAVARYNANLGHEASFMMSDQDPPTALGIFPAGRNLVFVGGALAATELRDFTGKRVGHAGDSAYDFAPNVLSLSASRVLSAGYSYGAPRSVAGRQFDAEVGFFHAFSATSGDLEVAFSVPNEGLHVGITGAALDAAGTSLVVAFGFNGAFELAGKTYGLPSTRGLALVRLKLPPPT